MKRMRALVAATTAITLTLVACGESEACAQKSGGSPPPAPKSPAPAAPKAPTAPAAPKAPTATAPKTTAATAPRATTASTAPATTRATTASKPPPTTPKAAGLPKPSVSASQARRYPGTVRPTVVYVPPPPPGYYLGDPFSPFNPYNRWNPLSPFYPYYFYGYAEKRPCKADAPPTPAVTEPQPNDFATTTVAPPPG